jgi:uncharacterized protein (UPF0254 family)
MNKQKKILICITGIIVLFIALLITLDLLAPRLVNLESTKVKIRQIVSEGTGGDLDYDRIGLSIFPRPGLVIEQATFSLPDTLAGTVDSVKVYAELLPLIKGKVLVSSLLIHEPSFSINISGKDKEQKEEQEQRSADNIKETLQPFLAALAQGTPDLEIGIENGAINIVENDKSILSFKKVDAELTSPAGLIRIDVECDSSVSDQIALTLKLDPEKLSLQGDMDLKKAQLKQISDLFYKPASRFVKDTELDLSFGFEADEKKININDLSGKMAKSAFSDLNVRFDLSQEEPYLSATSGTIETDLNELHEILFEIETVRNELKDLTSIEGTVELAIDNLEGRFLLPEKWDFKAKGNINNVNINFAKLPGQVTLSEGTFEATPQNISLKNVRAGMLDTDVNVSGLITNYMKGKLTAGLNINGTAGAGTGRWVSNIAKIPPRFKIDQPLTIDKARFDWKGGQVFSLNGSFSIPDSLAFDIDVKYDPTEIDIKKLEIRDNESNALIALSVKEKELHLKFSGNVMESTLSKLLVMDQDVRGWMKGDLDTKIHLDHPERFVTNGHLEGEHIIIPVKWKEELELKKVSLKATKDTINIISSEILLGKHVLTARGNIKGAEDGFVIDAEVSSDGIKWEEIEKFLGKEESDKKNKANVQESSAGIPVKGTVHVSSDFFSYGKYRWEPVNATITFDRDKLDIAVNNAVICNITTPGIINIKGDEIGIDFRVVAKKQQIGNSLDCLMEKEVEFTGSFDLKANVSGRGKSDAILRSLKGNAKLSINDGVIYKQTFFTRVFALINVTEVFRGNYADIETKGFTYRSIKLKADMSNGKIYLKEMTMDGSTMDMAGNGEVDLIQNRIDAIFIVAPLKTVNAVVKKIPILRDILGGTLITVAIKVTGEFEDTKVYTVPPSTVGEGLVGMMKRTVQLPFKLIDPEGKDNKSEDSDQTGDN